MAWSSGPVAALQNNGPDLYSSNSKRSPGIIDMMFSQPMPRPYSDSRWGSQYQQQDSIGTGNCMPNFVQPSQDQKTTYDCSVREIAEDESNFAPNLEAQCHSYTPIEPIDSYGNIIRRQSIPNAPTFSFQLDDGNTEPQQTYGSISDPVSNGAYFDGSFGFVENNTNILSNEVSNASFPDFFASHGDQYHSQNVSAPPDLYYEGTGAGTYELSTTSVTCISALHTPETRSRATSITRNPYVGTEEYENIDAVKQEDDFVGLANFQFSSVQTDTSWALGPDSGLDGLSTFDGTFCQTSQTIDTNTMLSLDTNISPHTIQSNWGDQLSASLINLDSSSWVPTQVTQNHMKGEANLPRETPHPVETTQESPSTESKDSSSPQQYDQFMSVMQVTVPARARGGDELSPPPNNSSLKLDDCLSNFESSPTEARKRKRTKFGPDAAQKVRQVRTNGACVSCRSRKTPCSTEGICKHCLKAACNNMQLAKVICLRTKLIDSYCGVKCFDSLTSTAIFGTLDSRREGLAPLLSSLSGQTIQINLSVKSSPEMGNRTAVLPLRVRQCTSDLRCRWKGLGKVKGIYVTQHSVYAPSFAVVPDSISIDDVANFARDVLSISDGTHSGQITGRITSFLDAYCRQKRSSNSKLRQFVDSTLKVVGLNGLVPYGSLDLRDGSYNLLHEKPAGAKAEWSYVSPTLHDQVRLIAAAELEKLEGAVFSQIDSFAKLIGSDKHARIVGGMCLMRLLLLYRDRAIRDEIRLSLPKQKLLHRERLEQSTFMYRRLTIAYGILCRDANTPLTTTWVGETNKSPGGRSNAALEDDRALERMFVRLRETYCDFCEKLNKHHDDVFKGLVVKK
ncbi:hypothetical protein HYALB_00010934 [Hymenoscyphus albidus]|uniref:Uncharacterized protein n=1 Tax=Hymenoscyphus albidus TaxID=595503 RepID=A0A9N9LH98_9HELO|nr:hypothetical protein HYALB_00010934 [Hymenoscyphus albidus]